MTNHLVNFLCFCFAKFVGLQFVGEYGKSQRVEKQTKEPYECEIQNKGDGRHGPPTPPQPPVCSSVSAKFSLLLFKINRAFYHHSKWRVTNILYLDPLIYIS
jgi:hypothetical protein